MTMAPTLLEIHETKLTSGLNPSKLTRFFERLDPANAVMRHLKNRRCNVTSHLERDFQGLLSSFALSLPNSLSPGNAHGRLDKRIIHTIETKFHIQ